MSNIFENQLRGKFAAAQTPNTNPLAPRMGYAYVRGIEYREVGKAVRQFTPIAIMNWKAESDSNQPFLEDVTFEMAVRSLYPNQKQEETNYESLLVGKLLHIFRVKSIQATVKGQPIPKLDCGWQFNYATPQFTNSSTESENFFKAAFDLNDPMVTSVVEDQSYLDVYTETLPDDEEDTVDHKTAEDENDQPEK